MINTDKLVEQTKAYANKHKPNTGYTIKAMEAVRDTVYPEDTNIGVQFALQFDGKETVEDLTQWDSPERRLPYKDSRSLDKSSDCSSFWQNFFDLMFGFDIGTWTEAQWAWGKRHGRIVKWSERRPLDLIFYNFKSGRTVSHVAGYIGNGKILHTTSPGNPLRVQSDSYGSDNYVGVVRVLTDDQYNSLIVKDNTPIPDSAPDVSVVYSAHIQNIGDQTKKRNGEVVGTTGQALRMEALEINIPKMPGCVEYRGHVQNIGWMDGVEAGKVAGTKGQSLRLEAVEIRLRGEAAEKYDIYYRLHVQDIGWMGWAKNGQPAGTVGMSLRGEAIQIVLVEKGKPAPGSTVGAFRAALGSKWQD